MNLAYVAEDDVIRSAFTSQGLRLKVCAPDSSLGSVRNRTPILIPTLQGGSLLQLHPFTQWLGVRGRGATLAALGPANRLKGAGREAGPLPTNH